MTNGCGDDIEALSESVEGKSNWMGDDRDDIE